MLGCLERFLEIHSPASFDSRKVQGIVGPLVIRALKSMQGWNGSGTIFFGLCNLRCVFCQNWDISQRKKGWELGAEEIADLMLKLQDETKCHNVNFVTPEHVVPQARSSTKPVLFHVLLSRQRVHAYSM